MTGWGPSNFGMTSLGSRNKVKGNFLVFLEGLNSSLAYSGGDLWPYPNWVLFNSGFLLRGRNFYHFSVFVA